MTDGEITATLGYAAQVRELHGDLGTRFDPPIEMEGGGALVVELGNRGPWTTKIYDASGRCVTIYRMHKDRVMRPISPAVSERIQRESVEESRLLDANERMGQALVQIGMALGLPRPRTGATWGAPEILARIAEQRVRTEWGVRTASGRLFGPYSVRQAVTPVDRGHGGVSVQREVRTWVGPWAPFTPQEEQ